MDKLTHTRKRRSVRMKGFDYSMPAQWFVTICTHERQCIFGEVVDDNMHINTYGKIIEEEWLKTATLRPNVIVGEYIIMPNHFHGLLEIAQEDSPTTRRGVARYAPTGNVYDRGKRMSAISPQSGSLGTIIRSFKSATTKRINELRMTVGAPLWQRNYFEHGVRSDRSLEEIRKYISANPLLWNEDQENPNPYQKSS